MKCNKNKTILNFEALFVTIVLLLTTCSVVAIADDSSSYDQISKTYSFDAPYINQVSIDGTTYDQIVMPNSPGVGNPGEPNLPAYGVNLLIPQKSEITDIEIITGERIFLGSGFNVEPIREPVKLSESDSFPSLVQNELTYNSEEIVPETLFTKIGEYNFRGYAILVLTTYPVQYIPKSGDLYYFKDLTVSVKTMENDQINPLFRNSEKDAIEVTKKVDNPSFVDSYIDITTAPLSSDNYDLMILTTEEFKNDFQPLKEAHDAEGIVTEIKTLKDISILPSSVTPEDIRDFIRDEYSNNGIQYVLIGGDADVVPAKELWVRAWAGGDTDFMPSDLYYACLDGTYNYDNDEFWGEFDDGENGEDVDLVAEVYIGRACAGSSSEVDNFVGKTVAYIESGDYSDGEVLMVGEYLWDNPDTWGGDYMDELINGSSAHMYTTEGIPSIQYDVDKLYDRDWPGSDWPKSEIIGKINNGARIINHLGHAYYGYDLKMSNSDIPSLINNDFSFVYSQGCMAGGFDNPDGYDCIAEYFTVKTDSAAFAVIMNARFGWGVVGSTDGASQRFHRQFWDAVFGENTPEIGKANQDSKEDNLNRINSPCMRWIYYQLNLFGDPALAFYTNENNAPNKPIRPSGIKTGKIGTEYTFTSSTTDLDGDQIYYKWDWGDGTFSEWLGPFDSDDETSAKHNWTSRGIYQVKVKARDEHRAESDWSDPSPVRMPLFNSFPLLRLFIEILEKLFPNLFL